MAQVEYFPSPKFQDAFEVKHSAPAHVGHQADFCHFIYTLPKILLIRNSEAKESMLLISKQ
jgi:hypothetical protein